jgi:hypothetical protein
LPVIAELLVEKVSQGMMTRRQAEQLCGFLALEDSELAHGMPRSTLRRRRKHLLEAGLAAADDALFEPVVVDLGAIFEVALGAWAAC